MAAQTRNVKCKVLLISPEQPPDTISIPEELFSTFQVRASIAPLGLATLAALVEEDISVEILDENIAGRVEDASYDWSSFGFVGITGMSVNRPRVEVISRFLRRLHVPVVIGGPGASAEPDHYRSFCDHLFIGEAEHTFPQFVQDFLHGAAKPVYRQIEKPDMAISPLPRWTLMQEDLGKYGLVPLQTTRGCPYDCDFCDVIFLYGRSPRAKPIPRVLEEVRQLYRLGCHNIFVSDDNFIGRPRYTKELLRALVELNNSFERPLAFRTQLSVNVAKDDELLELLADANFGPIFVGVESPSEAALKSMNKPQNYKTDMVRDLRKIQSYGIPVHAGMIVGSDSDDTSSFAEQFHFVQNQTYLSNPVVTMLNAPYGTKLWNRLVRQKRVLKQDESSNGPSLTTTNIIPLRMSRIELLEGFRWLIRKLYHPKQYFARIRRVVDGIKRKPQVNRPSLLRLAREELSRTTAILDYFARRAPREVRREFFKTVTHTMSKAPWFMEMTMQMIVQSHLLYLHTWQKTLPALEEAIEYERSNPEFEILSNPDRIPEAFLAVFDQVFPTVHGRLVEKLEADVALDEVVVEVFVDFLDRFGREFEGWEPHHDVDIGEICDRAVAQYNGSTDESGRSSRKRARLPIRPTNAYRRNILTAIKQSMRLSAAEAVPALHGTAS